MESKTPNKLPEIGLQVFSLLCACLLFWILVDLVAYHFDDELNGWEMQGEQMAIAVTLFIPVVLISLPLCEALKKEGELVLYRILASLIVATVGTAIFMFFSLLTDPNFH